MQKPKPQSKQAPFCTTILHETFSLFQHNLNLFKTTLLKKTNMDQRSKYTLIQRYNKMNKNQGEKRKLNTVLEKENTH
jgi:hypothetical protein